MVVGVVWPRAVATGVLTVLACLCHQFSVPKPKGGRGGDLLLAEDQMMVGVWAQRVKKKESINSFFADTNGASACCCFPPPPQTSSLTRHHLMGCMCTRGPTQGAGP